MGNPIITIQNMSFGYGKDNVLTNVNLTVEEQEYVGIIGANGAGKSTLMKLILGQLTPVQGEVTVATDSIGYVPQVGFQAVHNFPANVEEVVLTGLYREIGMFHLPKKRHRHMVADALELVGMQEYRSRMLSELSGGQQQRVMIARALIGQPKLLVLDEPLTGIDREAGDKLYRLLAKLNLEYGMTLVMVTHNMEQVARYTNRFYHVSNGSVHLDPSSILCDEVLNDKMRISKPKRYGTRHTSGKTNYTATPVEVPEKEAPYDASYKGTRSSRTQPAETVSGEPQTNSHHESKEEDAPC
ncbi:MAG: ABC transporter ATP-binding protein [Lachnospiraceae bacterium]|nr:ABC transporter ATP-binding protein [Lachnospiraceae bacterium]